MGSGDGMVTDRLRETGYDVLGVEPYDDAVDRARKAYPKTEFIIGSGYEDIKSRFGEFDMIVSTEVVEHLFTPWDFVERAREALKPGGLFIASAPYHGYLKNLLLTAMGKWDSHHDALLPGGHVRFFSRATLEDLVRRGGLEPIQFHTAGRIPPLAKSMFVVARKPM